MISVDKSGHYKDLIFSRQFLLGPRPFAYTDQWKITSLAKGIILSTHPKLDLEIKTNDNVTIVLLGYIIDPFNPTKTSAKILTDISEKATNVLTVIDATIHLSGRWVLIYLDSQHSVIFTDPCGLRQVYYHANKDGLWCGSQPEIIKAATGLALNTDKNLSEFIKSFDYQRKEYALVGDKTRYADCYHLLPNHFLDLLSGQSIRFFPKEKPSPVPIDEAVKIASSILRGSMEAISQRFSPMLAVTAGWDTRVLLASTKSISDRVEYYVDRKGVLSLDHPDVQVSQRLCRRLGVNFDVRNSSEDPPRWFMEILSQSLSGTPVPQKARMTYAAFINQIKSINVNGNASEVCRNAYDGYGLVSEDNITVVELAALIGYYKSKFVKNELSNWKEDLEKTGVRGYHILDFLYWEQGMGNWGTQHAAEQDIAIEDFSPFNNRLILKTLLSLPREYRSGPDFPIYTKLIETMWPETLQESINPRNFVFSHIHCFFYHLPIPLWARLKLIRFVFVKWLKCVSQSLKRTKKSKQTK
jgi:hypothetical protein